MTLTMADGPVASLPAGMDAYAGYVDDSGIGVTYPAVVAAFPNAIHFSISIHGNPAMCADVEQGAMNSWTGYQYGYCSASNAASLIARYGRPPKLWLAHYGAGEHLCGPSTCGYPQADGTQWTDNGGVWDQSTLADDFFPGVNMLTPADVQLIVNALNPAFGQLVYGDSKQSAETGVPVNGHPFNLYQIYADLQDLKAEVAALKIPAPVSLKGETATVTFS